MADTFLMHIEAVNKHLSDAKNLVADKAGLRGEIDDLIQRISQLAEVKETVAETHSSESSLDNSVSYRPKVFDISTLLSPISKETPGGIDCRLSGDMNRLLSLVVNRKRETDFHPQYSEAEQLSLEILSGISKDLGVAVRLIEASFVSKGLPALAEGLLLINGLLENFWLTLFPEYDEYDFEPRGNAIQGLQELICAQIQLTIGTPHTYAPNYNSREAVESEKSVLDCALEELDKLNKYCYDNFADDAPNLDDLRKDIQVLHNAMMREYQIYLDQDNAQEISQKQAEEKASLDAQLAQEKEEARRNAPAVSAEPESLEDVLSRLEVCSSYLLENHTDDPLAYVINRGMYWYSNLIADKNDEPSTDDQKAVANLASAANAKGLLQQAEKCFAAGGQNWIDLQWYQVLSSTRLGKGYSRLTEVLSDMTDTYISHQESLKSHCFSDETAAVSEGAQKWLTSIEKRQGVAGGTATESGFDDILAEAEALIAKAGIGDALEHLIHHVESAKSGREATLWQLYLVEFAIKHGQAKPVIPYVEKLVEEIASENLHAWEDRKFLGRVYKAGYDCYINAYGVQKAPKERVDHFYNLVCSTNPIAFIQTSN